MEDKNIPNHIGFIIDGNRRWAKERGKTSFFGHKQGMENVSKIIKLCIKKSIKYVSVYAFSTENWNRNKKEVNYLMKLFAIFAKKHLNEFHKLGVRVQINGQFEKLPKFLQKTLKKAIEKTKNNKEMVIQICLSYGGRTEVIDAIKKIVKKGIDYKNITEDLIAKNLYSAEVPDPDFIVRTSGEHRLSNFMTWQGVYSELYFPKCHWPAFDKTELEKALKEFAKRQRRFGR